MRNTTSPSPCSLNNTGLDLLVWQIGAFVLPVVGLPGNLLIIVTMLSCAQRRSHPTSLYYVFIAISESVYLIFLFWDWLDAVNLAPDPRKSLDCAFFYPFVASGAFISLLLILQVNFDRLRIIHHPQTTYPHLTHRRVLLKILLVYSTSILFFLNYRFSLQYDSQAFTIFGQACRVYDRAHFWFYSIWPYIHLLCRLIPCLVLISCTIYVCYNRYRNDPHSTSSISSRSIHRRQQTFSVAIVFLSFYTFFAVLPITILQIFNHQMWLYEMTYQGPKCRSDTMRAINWKLLNALFIIWEASTYTNKFYIRLIFSLEFRQDVKEVLRGRCGGKYRPASFVSS